MTLHRSMWKAAVLMGIAGVLMFAGGASAAWPFTQSDVTVTWPVIPSQDSIALTPGRATGSGIDSIAIDLNTDFNLKVSLPRVVASDTTVTVIWRKHTSALTATPAGNAGTAVTSGVNTLSPNGRNRADISEVNVKGTAGGLSWWFPVVRMKNDSVSGAWKAGDSTIARPVMVMVRPAKPNFTTQPKSEQITQVNVPVKITVGNSSGGTVTRRWQINYTGSTNQKDGGWQDSTNWVTGNWNSATEVTFQRSTQGTFSVRSIARREVSSAVSFDTSEIGVIKVNKHKYTLDNTNFRFVILSKDTTFTGDSITPSSWKVERKSGSNWITAFTNTTPKVGVVDATTSTDSIGVIWGENIDAGTGAGSVTITVRAVGGSDGALTGGGTVNNDTLYEGSASWNFNIIQRTLTTGNIDTYFKVYADSLVGKGPVKYVPYDGSSLDAFVVYQRGKGHGATAQPDSATIGVNPNEDGIQIYYQFGSSTTWLNGMTNAGTYKTFIRVLAGSKNFVATSGTAYVRSSSSDLSVEKAQIYTRLNDAATSDDADANITVEVDADKLPIFNNMVKPKFDTGYVTIRLKSNPDIIVPRKDYSVQLDSINAQENADFLVTLKSNSANFMLDSTGGNAKKIKGKVTILPGSASKAHFKYAKANTGTITYDGKNKGGTVGWDSTKTGDPLTGKLTVKYNGQDSTFGSADDPAFPANVLPSGKYLVTVGIEGVANLRDTSGIVVDSFEIAKVVLSSSNIRTYLNLGETDGTTANSVEKALKETLDAGKGIKAGAESLDKDLFEVKLWDSTTPKWSGLGAVTVEFGDKNSSTGTWTASVPGKPGDYFMRVKVAEGSNFKALATPFVLTTNKLHVVPDSLTEDAFTLYGEPETAVYGRAKSSYTFHWPTVDPQFGTIDTLEFGAIETKGDQTGTYKVGSVSKSAATFTVVTSPAGDMVKPTTIVVGEYAVKARVKGSRKEGGAVVESWVFDSVELSFEIQAKDLEASDISIAITATAAQLVYGGTAKTPTATVKEGTATLVKDSDYELNKSEIVADLGDDINQTKAGAAELVVSGKGNYTGAVNVPFTITKAVLTPEVASVGGRAQDKIYDGTTFIDTTDANGVAYVSVNLKGLIGDDVSAVAMFSDYLITDAKIDNANVGNGRTITATVALVASDLTANYQFEGGAESKTITGTASNTKVNVKQLNPKDYLSNAFVPAEFALSYFYNGREQTLSTAPVLKEGLVLGGDGAYRIHYYGASDAAIKDSLIPKEPGTYYVRAIVTGTSAQMNVTPNSNANNPLGYELGTLTIAGEAKPTFAGNTPRDTTVRFGKSVGISVNATAPVGSNGTLSYEWYKYAAANSNDTTGTLVSIGPTFNYTASDSVGSVLYFGVKVINTYDGYSASAYAPRKSKVTVLVPPVSMAAATLTVDSVYLAPGFTYTGSEIKLDLSKVKVQMPNTTVNGVVVPGAVLIANKDFELIYTNNKNAGTASVVANGLDAYEDATAAKTFVINKKTLTPADFTWNTANVSYTADTVSANVKSKDSTATAATLGTVVVKYAGATALPVNAGIYALTVDVAGGSNYNATTGLVLGNFTINKAVIDTSWLNYKIPTGHVVGKPDTLGIGPVTMKKGTGVKSITVKYNGLAALPTAASKYIVTVDILADSNFFSAANLALGTYEVATGIASGNTKIPTAPKAAVVTVAPVKVAAASFTAGPSPVSKNGVIKFFSAKQVKSGSLYIFDANGNVVTKLSAKAGSGEIASWNLKDKKGASVAEGTYVVKGALAAKDGTREKVSFVFSVVK